MITAQLATIPGREESVTKTVASLENQADEIVISWNGYDFARGGFLGEKFTNRYTTNNNLGDAEKFWAASTAKGYIFTCDDDLIYPPDYVKTMIRKIEQYGRKASITCHGRTFPKREIKSYYRDKLEGFRCLGTVERDVHVDSGGTGVMAWHSDLWRPEMDWFKAPNMADIFIAVEARKRNIPIICIEHLEGWIRYIDQAPGSTIWEKHVNDDSLQTFYFNEGWYD